MESPWWVLARFMVLVVGAFLCYRVFYWFLTRHAARQEQLAASHKCACGYLLEGLKALRCPECGRVIGFDATAEDLGLSREELERAHLKRTQRERGDGCQ
jgi:hypothetical protein